MTSSTDSIHDLRTSHFLIGCYCLGFLLAGAYGSYIASIASYWLLQGFSPTRLIAFSFLVQGVLELPSSFIADRWGRIRILLIGMIAQSIGYGGYAFRAYSPMNLDAIPEVSHILICEFFLALGFSLISGVFQAFVLDGARLLEPHRLSLVADDRILAQLGACEKTGLLAGGALSLLCPPAMFLISFVATASGATALLAIRASRKFPFFDASISGMKNAEPRNHRRALVGDILCSLKFLRGGIVVWLWFNLGFSESLVQTIKYMWRHFPESSLTSPSMHYGLLKFCSIYLSGVAGNLITARMLRHGVRRSRLFLFFLSCYCLIFVALMLHKHLALICLDVRSISPMLIYGISQGTFALLMGCLSRQVSVMNLAHLRATIISTLSLGIFLFLAGANSLLEFAVQSFHATSSVSQVGFVGGCYLALCIVGGLAVVTRYSSVLDEMRQSTANS